MPAGQASNWSALDQRAFLRLLTAFREARPLVGTVVAGVQVNIDQRQLNVARGGQGGAVGRRRLGGGGSRDRDPGGVGLGRKQPRR